MRVRLESFAGAPTAGEAWFRLVARRCLAECGPLRVEQRYRKPAGFEWNDDTYPGATYGVFSYASCCVEVEVDLDTGEVQVLEVTTAQDIGKAIHPVLAEGQIEGGTLQGLGWALLEEVRFKDGRVWNHQLTNYIIPTSADAPTIRTILVENPYSGGPRGAKGVGELPMDVPAPAVLRSTATVPCCGDASATPGAYCAVPRVPMSRAANKEGRPVKTRGQSKAPRACRCGHRERRARRVTVP